MIKDRTIYSRYFPLMLVLIFAVAHPVMAAGPGSEDETDSALEEIKEQRQKDKCSCDTKKKHKCSCDTKKKQCKEKDDEKGSEKDGKKEKCKKEDMPGAMGLTMTNIMPCKTMKFLEHFKKWVEVEPKQETAWGVFSKVIKLQAANEPYQENMMVEMSPVQRAEKQIAWAMKVTAMKKNTLRAYKALQKVLDKRQVQLADIFLAKHTKMHHSKKNADD